ncbi:hypothetical protein QQG55_40890 [Brugia pahangi]|uniref:Secreted protein n=1 Tax=Brugia pahangi TaxID=6280 RepID=A0A0N4TV16_BRUPA|nr:unnamed protein product [Brugia pahangi]
MTMTLVILRAGIMVRIDMTQMETTKHNTCPCTSVEIFHIFVQRRQIILVGVSTHVLQLCLGKPNLITLTIAVKPPTLLGDSTPESAIISVL